MKIKRQNMLIKKLMLLDERLHWKGETFSFVLFIAIVERLLIKADGGEKFSKFISSPEIGVRIMDFN